MLSKKMSKNCQLGKKVPMGLGGRSKRFKGQEYKFQERAGVSVQVSAGKFRN